MTRFALCAGLALAGWAAVVTGPAAAQYPYGCTPLVDNAPQYYVGGNYGFNGNYATPTYSGYYAPGYTSSSYYTPTYSSYYSPACVAPVTNNPRYYNPGPYYYTPTRSSYYPSYYSYYYTPGYFRY